MNKLIFFLFLLLSTEVVAQTPAYVRYYDSAQLESGRKDGAVFTRFYFKSDTALINDTFTIREYAHHGKMNMIGSVYFKNDREFRHGTFNFYDESGTLREIINYKNGYKFGMAYSFYPNRELKKEVNYEYHTQHDTSLEILEGQGLNHESTFARGKLLTYIDSLGVKVITNGNGYLKLGVEYLGEAFLEEGKYANGLKEGLWTLTLKGSTITYSERYKDGDFVDGVLLKDGIATKYKYQLQRPTLPRINFVKSYVATNETLNDGRLYQHNFYAHPGTALLDNIKYKKVRADFKFVIDEQNKLNDIEFVTFLPKEVREKLKSEFLALKYFRSGVFRGQKRAMKLPSWLIVYYDENLID